MRRVETENHEGENAQRCRVKLRGQLESSLGRLNGLAAVQVGAALAAVRVLTWAVVVTAL